MRVLQSNDVAFCKIRMQTNYCACLRASVKYPSCWKWLGNAHEYVVSVWCQTETQIRHLLHIQFRQICLTGICGSAKSFVKYLGLLSTKYLAAAFPASWEREYSFCGEQRDRNVLFIHD